MGGIGRWVSTHVGLVVALAVLLALVTAGSVARCCTIHAPSDEELPSDYRALRKSYPDTTREALGMLAANVWADSSGNVVVAFTDRSLCIRTQGDETWVAYAVLASSKKQVTQDGKTSTMTTMCLRTPEWADIATLAVPSTGGDGTYPTFSCPSICGGSELVLSPALKEVALDGPDDAILAALGTNREAAGAELASWCALWRPTATVATWTKVIEEDHEERVCRVYYKLDDQRGSAVTLVVGMGDGRLSVEEGGR